MHESNNGNIYGTAISIKPHYSVIYSYLVSGFRPLARMPEHNTARGYISKKARSRIITAMNWMMLFSDRKFVYSKSKKRGFWFKINFITLTLSAPQQHPDQYIQKHMLQPFLKWLRRKHNVINYIWKAEIQPERLLKRGERCIHFHITTNKFVPWRQIRNKWNELQLAHGYREPDTDPNSTDVHSCRNDKQIVRYMGKYVSKEPDKEDYPDATEEQFQQLFVTCKVWAMNHELSNMKASLEEDSSSNITDNISHFLNITNAREVPVTHGNLYLHRLNIETPYPAEITTQLTKNYELFMQGDNHQTKYTDD